MPSNKLHPCALGTRIKMSATAMITPLVHIHPVSNDLSLTSFYLPSTRPSGVSGHVQGKWVLQLRPVPEAHPEQHRWDHAVLPDSAAKRPPASHRQVGRLRQSVSEKRSCVPGHQPGLGRLRGSRGAVGRQVQRQRMARCPRVPQPASGNVTFRGLPAPMGPFLFIYEFIYC